MNHSPPETGASVHNAQSERGNGLGLGAFVTAIAGLLVTLLLGILVIGVVVGGFMGGTAMAFGLIARHQANRGMATGGGLALAGAIVGCFTVLVAVAFGVFDYFWYTSEGWD